MRSLNTIHYIDRRFNPTHSTLCGKIAETNPALSRGHIRSSRGVKVQDEPWRAVTCKRCLKAMDKANIVLPPVPMVERTNFMSGEKFMEPADTPYYCSPSSETYWST